MKSKLCMIVFFALAFSFTETTFGKEFLLLRESPKKFLGCFGCSEFNSDSICNEYGTFGNSYSSDSIWNEYSTIDNGYSTDSPWNEYSSSAPIIVDRAGGFYGRFSINTYSGFSQSDDLKALYDSVDGDLDELQKLFCKAF